MLTAVAAAYGASPHSATLLRDGWLHATIVLGDASLRGFEGGVTADRGVGRHDVEKNAVSVKMLVTPESSRCPTKNAGDRSRR
jgi:hypothetical protein